MHPCPAASPRTQGIRPSKWKPEVIIPLTIGLRVGMPIALSVPRARVGKSTLHRWIDQTRSGDSRFAAPAEHANLLNLGVPAPYPWNGFVGRRAIRKDRP
jgi:hypothetical protein